MEIQKLTVHNYAETPEEERRVTLSPGNIAAIAATAEDVMVGGRSLRGVTVLFLDGGSLDILLDHQDLEKVESAIGSYCLG